MAPAMTSFLYAAGWHIIFDEAACSRYRESQDTALREAFHQNVLRNEEPAADGTIPFARVKLTEQQSSGATFLADGGAAASFYYGPLQPGSATGMAEGKNKISGTLRASEIKADARIL